MSPRLKYAHERSPSIDQITETPFQATKAANRPRATTASRESDGRSSPASAPTMTAVATASAATPIQRSRPPDDPAEKSAEPPARVPPAPSSSRAAQRSSALSMSAGG